MRSIRALSEAGNVALYVAALLPLAVTFTVLAVDVSRFQLMREEAQKEADRIVLQAVQALPNVELARLIVERNVGALRGLRLASGDSGDPSRAAIAVGDSRVALTLEGEVEGAFDIFLRLNGGKHQVFRVVERSEAQLVPQDIAIVFSDAVSLRPRPREAWGDASAWPASRYFDFVFPPRFEGALPAGNDENVWARWWEEWYAPEFRRWATQSCFNPAYSELKRGALLLAGYFSQNRANRLALYFTPGGDPARGVRLARQLGFGESGLVPAEERLTYFDAGSYLGDETCVFFADRESAASTHYEPPSLTASPERSACGRLTSTRWGEVFYPFGFLSECFLSETLSLRELIYFHAVRNIAHAASGENISRAGRDAVRSLIAVNPQDASVLRERRGNLAPAALRQVFIFTDLLPPDGDPELVGLLEDAERFKVSIHFVSMLHDGLAADQASVLLQRAAALSSLRSARLKLTVASRAGELPALVSKLIAASREAALRS